ncbi:MAG: hypothetical protein PVF17_12640 [Ignavibacteria bacterium]|jgi:hypothetical protein
MAKKVKKKNIRKSKKTPHVNSPFSIYWEKQNYILLIIGFIIIIVGFYFMSIGPWNSIPSLEISPILLVIGFILVFPASIFYKKRDSKNSLKAEDNDSGKS